MWNLLSQREKENYKRLILAFASLTEMFAQKETINPNEIPAPFINSKFQETAFQKSFNAKAEDIGNTAYDASLTVNGHTCLVGIKTFGIDSGYQKIAQFKALRNSWSSTINAITENVKKAGRKLTKDEILSLNRELYLDLAIKISQVRNDRIESAEAQALGPDHYDQPAERIYHVLMPSKKNTDPKIYVGETSYSKINIDQISNIELPSAVETNFNFCDGIHNYRFTAADSQLLMNFDNRNIVVDSWDVIYADNAMQIFEEIASKVYGGKKRTESISWLITKSDGEVPRYSGFNAFYGVGSKLSTKTRKDRITGIYNKYSASVPKDHLDQIIEGLNEYLLNKKLDKLEKENLRSQIMSMLDTIGNLNLSQDVMKLIFRPKDELYIPFPYSREFHTKFPDFFKKDLGRDINTKLDRKSKENRCFSIILQPSGTLIECVFTQQDGKAIESISNQGILGEWIRRGVFQLKEYEPLTAKRLNELGINAIRMDKIKDGLFELYFTWIDPDDLPSDFIGNML